MNTQKQCTKNSNTWCLRFAWLPHRCWLTGRWIWLDFAYHKENDRYKNMWHSEESHILWVLKEGH